MKMKFLIMIFLLVGMSLNTLSKSNEDTEKSKIEINNDVGDMGIVTVIAQEDVSINIEKELTNPGKELTYELSFGFEKLSLEVDNKHKATRDPNMERHNLLTTFKAINLKSTKGLYCWKGGDLFPGIQEGNKPS